MKQILLLLIMLLSLGTVSAVSAPINYNGNEYYIVSADDPTEDSGNEVCAKVGKTCAGYLEKTTALCTQVHPTATTLTSLSGDASGTYCDGTPQNGVCATAQNTCLECPTCTTSVTCDQPIGGLYKEMYVACVAPPTGNTCSIHIGAKTVPDFISQIPGLNTQLQNCPLSLPSGSGLLFKDGATQVNVNMQNGATQSFTMTLTNGQITSIQQGSSSCKQKITISETHLTNAINSVDFGQAIGYLYGQKAYSVQGCSIAPKIRLFFVNLFAPKQVQKLAPTAPTVKATPNCGNVGEQCNNRGCFSGMCASQKTQNSDGRWGYWDYKCIDQRQYDAYCVGRGNTPPAWGCLTGICQ